MADDNIKFTIEGDAASLLAAVNQSNAHLSALVESVGNLGKATSDSNKETKEAVDALGDQQQAFAGLYAASQVAFGAVRSFVGQLSAFTDASSGAEDANVRLNAALQAAGTYTPAIEAQFAALATKYEALTGIADDLIVEQMALFTTIGKVGPENMEAAIKAMADLSSTGIGLRQSTMLISQALQGNTGRLERYTGDIDKAKLATDGARVVFDAVAASMEGGAAKAAETFSGKMRQVANVIDNAREGIGALLSSAVEPLLDSFLGLSEPVRTAVTDIGLIAGVGGVAYGAITSLVAGFGALLPVVGVAVPAGVTALTGVLTAALVPALTVVAAVAAVVAAAFAGYKFAEWVYGFTTVAKEAKLNAEIHDQLAGMIKKAADESPKLRIATDDLTRSDQELAAIEKELTASAEASIKANQAHAEAMKKAADEAERLGKIRDQAFGLDKIAAVNDTIAAIGGVENISKMTAEAIRTFSDTLDAAIAVAKRQGLADIAAKFEAIVLPVDALTASMGSLYSAMSIVVPTVEQLTAGVAQASIEMGNLTLEAGFGAEAMLANARSTEEANRELERLGMLLPQLAITNQNVSQQVQSETTGLMGSLKSIISENLGGLNQIFMAAFTGGGGALGAVQAFATKAVESVLGMIPVVGTFLSKFAGPMIEGFKKIGSAIKRAFGGPSEEEIEGRSVAEKFRDELALVLTEAQKLEVQTHVNAGRSAEWATSVIAIRDAYLAHGRSAEEALAIADRLWRAEKEGGDAVQQVIDEIVRTTRGSLIPAQDLARESGVSSFESIRSSADRTDTTVGDLAKTVGEDVPRAARDAASSADGSFSQIRNKVVAVDEAIRVDLMASIAAMEAQLATAANGGTADFEAMALAIEEMKRQLAEPIVIPVEVEQPEWPERPSGGGGGGGGGGDDPTLPHNDDDLRAIIERFLRDNPGDYQRIPSATGISPATLHRLGIPGFAQGGFVKPFTEVLALLHGGPRGEIIAPVDQLERSMRGGSGIVGPSRVDQHIHLTLDGREIAHAIVPELPSVLRARGVV